jgi:hypothetical protein
MEQKSRYWQWLIGLGLGWGFVVTLLRGLRRPNDWAEAHWLISYDFGFLKRALPGTFLQLLIAPGRDLIAVESAILLVSSFITAILCVVLLMMSVAILRQTHFAANTVFVLAALLTSPFIVMSAHLNGYFDGQIILLSWLAILFVWRGRSWAAALAIAIGLLIHETIFLIGFPAVLWAAVLRLYSQRRSGDHSNHSGHSTAARSTAGWLRHGPLHSLLPFLLPVLLFIFLFIQQSLAFDPLTLEHELTAYLQKFAFIEYDQEVIVPRAYTKSFVAYVQTQGPRFAGRLFTPGLMATILPNLALSLWLLRQWLRGGRFPKSVVAIGLLLPLLPLGLHLVAWDTSRIWTYPLMVALLLLWTATQAAAPGRLEKANSLLLTIASPLVIALNLFSRIPLMDWRVERFTPVVRLLLYLPLLLALAAVWWKQLRPTTSPAHDNTPRLSDSHTATPS